MSGAVVLLLGVTGLMKAVVRLLPTPVILAGILIKCPIDMVKQLETQAPIVIAGVVGYVIASRLGGLFVASGGVVGTIMLGAVAADATGQLDFSGFHFGFGQVAFHTPTFTTEALLTIVLPLALMLVGAENMQAIGILKASGHRRPITAATVISGLVASAFGSENANRAGPTPAVFVHGRRCAATVYDAVMFHHGTLRPSEPPTGPAGRSPIPHWWE